MKKLVWAAAVAAVVLAGIVAVRSFTGESARAEGEVSARAARSLQAKIDAIKKANAATAPRKQEEVAVSESELESYVLYSMREDIPARIDSFHVHLTPGEVASDTRLTFDSNPTGNPVLDLLVGGSHDLHLKGRLAAADGRGKFDLEEVHVDGIPVPMILIDSLISKYVKPQYPDVDLKKPFDMPWGIESLTIGSGEAKIVY